MSEEAAAKAGLELWQVVITMFGGGSLLSWLGRRTINRVDTDIERLGGDVKALQKSDSDCKLDLANFKTEVAKEYAKDTTMQQSLARIHEKIEKLADKTMVEALGDEIGEVRDGITKILTMMAQNGRTKATD